MTVLKQHCIVLAASLALFAGCTKRGPQAVEIGDGAQPTPVEQGQKPGASADGVSTLPDGSSPSGQTKNVDTGAGGQAEVPVELSEESLKHVAYQINTENLTYRFKYLTIEKTGDIKFDAGKARLTFSGLPTGQRGDMTLELLEESKVVFRGVSPSVELKKGPNNVDMTLKLVEDASDDADDTTDLTIDVTLDDGTGNGGTGNGSTGGGNTGDNTGGGSTGGGNTGDNTGGGNTGGGNDNDRTSPDPIEEWDGRSFKGNSRWKIVPVE